MWKSKHEPFEGRSQAFLRRTNGFLITIHFSGNAKAASRTDRQLESITQAPLCSGQSGLAYGNNSSSSSLVLFSVRLFCA